MKGSKRDDEKDRVKGPEGRREREKKKKQGRERRKTLLSKYVNQLLYVAV